MWTFACKGVILEQNEVYGQGKCPAGGPDACGFDIDGLCENNIFQYNYSRDNWGESTMVCNWDDDWLGLYGMITSIVTKASHSDKSKRTMIKSQSFYNAVKRRNKSRNLPIMV